MVEGFSRRPKQPISASRKLSCSNLRSHSRYACAKMPGVRFWGIDKVDADRISF